MNNDIPVAVRPAPPNRKGRRKIGRTLLLLGLVGIALAAVYFRRDKIAETFPSVASPLASYKRGFGDTVLQYADRSYDGAQWELIQESDSLSTLIPANPLARTRFVSVAGWDSENFCVTANAGWRNDVFFWCVDEHWTYRGESRNQASAYKVATRFLGKDRLVYLGNIRVAIVSPDGVTEYDDDFLKWPTGEVCTVSEDLIYFFDGHDEGIFKLSGNDFSRLKKDRDKETFIHKRNNAPLKEYGVDQIRLTHSRQEGHAIGLCYQNEWGRHPVVVQYESGTWYKIEDVSDGKSMSFNAAWLTPDSASGALVLVRDAGNVLVHEIGGLQRKQNVTSTQETTSADLIAVWGVDLGQYWVMDKNGTVWQRTENQWRVVVRGMYRNDVEFTDAWISPTGTVVAITEDAVYRLE